MRWPYSGDAISSLLPSLVYISSSSFVHLYLILLKSDHESASVADHDKAYPIQLFSFCVVHDNSNPFRDDMVGYDFFIVTVINLVTWLIK